MSSKKEFVHLHVHTEYSLLDGLSKIDRMMQRVKEMNMPSVAITDHGVMFGVIEFFRAAKKAGVKPIIGMEAYLARRGMEDRDAKLDSKPYHLLLLAKNETGYKNLLKLASEAQIRGYYYRPRIDKGLLAQHAEGLIATTGCLAAEIPRMLEAGKEDAELRDLLGWYQDVFGPENFYMELQQHDIPQLEVLNKWLVENSKYANVPLLATNDVHYIDYDDHDPHDTLLCIQTGNVKNEQNRMRMTDPSYHLRSPEEMWDLFGDVPEALTNSLKIAEQCEIDLEHDGYRLPVFPVPEGFTEKDYLRYLCEMGLEWRYGPRAKDPVVVERLDYELKIIDEMGFNTYFLIVWDLCEFARHADIWWNVRGSGAGSVAAYSLGITSIDPLRNSLIFERFLNPGRVSMPDIDLDYPDDRRAEMIEYTAQKYGEDKVAAIITFGTMGSKAAIRDVGRAFDMPLPDVNRIAGMLPSGAKPVKFKDALGDEAGKAVPELKAAYNTDRTVRRLIDTARSLEGVVRHASTHAAGVIVSDQPLTDYIPLHRPTKGGAGDNVPVKLVTQFDMETCESIGLLKVDFLGLATLTIMRKACELIEQEHGIQYSMENIPYRPDPTDPQKTRMVEQMFEMIGRGETIGVFQVESAGMRKMLTEMRPQTFEHIIAAISLYRPGPMDYIPQFNHRLHGEEPVEFHHEKLKPILEETYGIIVYQEQIMQIAAELFGYDLGEADLMRRAVAKKKKEKLLEHREKFIQQGPDFGVDPETAEKIFADIEFFARYGFNKCVVGETEIINADTGCVVQVRDLAEGRADVRRTLSFDTASQRLLPGTITHVMENGVKPVYRLTTRLGQQIDATANHPFYTFDGWRLLGELAVGDAVAVLLTANVAASMVDSVDRVRHDGDDVYWDKVVSIEYIGDEPTYDLTVEGTHSFIANDFIVHNSHAADYAVITCQTAFLKTHYPVEYMAALLSVQREDSAKVAVFTAECRRMGIPILPPDVNASDLEFTIELDPEGKRGIRYGLAAIKNVGMGPLQHIVEQREDGGPFTDLGDFCKRVDLRVVQKRALDSLIRVGALRQFGTRPQLLAAIDRMLSYSAEQHRAQDVGQMSLFGESTGVEFDEVEDLLSNLPDIPEASKREMLAWEKELVGLYVTEHPLDSVLNYIQSPYSNVTPSREIKDEMDRWDERQVALVGLVAGVRALMTKRGDMMAVLTLEDLQGQIDAVLFPRTWSRFQDMIEEDKIIRVQGKVDTKRGDAQIIVDSVSQDFNVSEEVGGGGTPDVLAKLQAMPVWSESEAAPPPPVDDRDEPPDDDDDLYAEEPPPPAEPAPPPAPPAPPAYVAPSTAGAAPNAPDLVPQVTPPPPVPPTPSTAAGGRPVWAEEADLLPSYEPTTTPERHGVVTVRFARCGDADKDRRRLRRIHGELISFSGADHFQIVVESELGDVMMRFPNDTTGYSDGLAAQIRGLPGVKEVNWQVVADDESRAAAD